MSALPNPLPPLPDLGYACLRMTADEYLAIGPTAEHYELIDGVVVMSPSPTPLHQKIKLLIARQLIASAGGSAEPEVFLDTDIRFGNSVVYCPDVAAYRHGRFLFTPSRLIEPLDLIVEVLSPGNKPLDLVTKRTDYERFGVGEYWIIDPETAEIRAWRREQGRYAAAPIAGDSATFASLPGLSLDLRPILAMCRPA